MWLDLKIKVDNEDLKTKENFAEIVFIIFCDFLIVKQIVLSLQAKQSVITNNELAYTIWLMSCLTV